jgi:hypothetical protein
LVNIIIVKAPRTTENKAQMIVQNVHGPKGTQAALPTFGVLWLNRHSGAFMIDATVQSESNDNFEGCTE